MLKSSKISNFIFLSFIVSAVARSGVARRLRALVQNIDEGPHASRNERVRVAIKSQKNIKKNSETFVVWS